MSTRTGLLAPQAPRLQLRSDLKYCGPLTTIIQGVAVQTSAVAVYTENKNGEHERHFVKLS